MDILVWIIGGLLVNMVIGAIVMVCMDTNDVFLEWYEECPIPVIGNFIILQLWPVMAIFMYIYRKNYRKSLHDGNQKYLR